MSERDREESIIPDDNLFKKDGVAHASRRTFNSHELKVLDEFRIERRSAHDSAFDEDEHLVFGEHSYEPVQHGRSLGGSVIHSNGRPARG